MLSEESRNRSKCSNTFRFLRSREIGPLSGVNAERDYCQMMASNMRLINEYSLNDYVTGDIYKVNYIKGTPSYILGSWTANSDNYVKRVGSYLTHQPLDVNRGLLHHKEYFHAQMVTDLCDGPSGTVLYTYNTPRRSRGGMAIAELVFAESDFNFIHRRHKYNLHLPIYCCASSTDHAHFALGSDKVVTYKSIVSDVDYAFLPLYHASKVYTISFDRSSNLMVTGLRNGYINLWDMRIKKGIMNIRASRSIRESYFLEPDQVIVAGRDNMLCRIDLRMCRIIREYLSHKVTTKWMIARYERSAISVANNMVCVTGADNVIRIWHLLGGNPIHEIHPYISPDNNVRGWLFSEASKTYLYHFEAGFRRTFLIS